MPHRSSYEIIITFGKYKGYSLGFIADTEPAYLRWISQTISMPQRWRDASKAVLEGADVSSFALPKSFYGRTPNCEAIFLKKDTILVKFEYDAELLARFKLAIDGRKWNSDYKGWEIPAVQILKLVEFFGGTENIRGDEKVKELYHQEKKRKEDLDVIRAKETSNIDIPTILPLFPYQKTAVEFAERAGGRVMIADQVGLGKTATSIGYAVRNKFKTIVVCPKSAIPVWMHEVKKFTGKNAVCWVSEGRLGRSDAQFQILNYDIVDKHLKEINTLGFDLLVCDEATYLKNRTTKRSKIILGYWKKRKEFPGIKAEHCFFLTGTPVLNRPVEAYHLLNHLDKNRFNNFYSFIQRYGGWRGSVPRNLDELHERTKELVIRRVWEEVATELPEKQRNDLYIEMSPGDMKEYNEHLNKLFRRWRQLGKPTVAEMPAIQRFLLRKKMPRAIEMIDELLGADQGVLVYSTYIEPLRFLKKHYKEKAALYYGGLSTEERESNKELVASGKVPIGLFSIGAGAMSINGLQHQIHTVIFLDRWWVPAVHQQAEGRVYRRGQKQKVQIYYLMCEGTLDEYMQELLEEKMKMIEQVVDGRVLAIGSANKSFFKDFVRKLKTTYNLDINEESAENTVSLM